MSPQVDTNCATEGDSNATNWMPAAVKPQRKEPDMLFLLSFPVSASSLGCFAVYNVNADVGYG